MKTDKQLDIEIEQDRLTLFSNHKMNCMGCCHPKPVIATHGVFMEGYHIEDGKVIVDTWNEYMCDSCYQEYKENNR